MLRAVFLCQPFRVRRLESVSNIPSVALHSRPARSSPKRKARSVKGRKTLLVSGVAWWSNAHALGLAVIWPLSNRIRDLALQNHAILSHTVIGLKTCCAQGPPVKAQTLQYQQKFLACISANSLVRDRKSVANTQTSAMSRTPEEDMLKALPFHAQESRIVTGPRIYTSSQGTPITCDLEPSGRPLCRSCGFCFMG